MEINEVSEVKKRGRKPKNQNKEVEINKDQTRFYVDLRDNKESQDLIFSFLTKCNEKNYGKPILFKELCVYAIGKLNEKDIDKIKEHSLSEMEKVQKTVDDYNKKHNTNLSMGEFLVKKLGIN